MVGAACAGACVGWLRLLSLFEEAVSCTLSCRGVHRLEDKSSGVSHGGLLSAWLSGSAVRAGEGEAEAEAEDGWTERDIVLQGGE